MRAAAALLLSIRVDAAVHFVVLSDINSGSTFFQQVLDSHPKVEMQREPLRKIELPDEKRADARAPAPRTPSTARTASRSHPPARTASRARAPGVNGLATSAREALRQTCADVFEFVTYFFGFESPPAESKCMPSAAVPDQRELAALGFSWQSTQGWAVGSDGKAIRPPAKSLHLRPHISHELLAYLQRHDVRVLVLHRTNAIAHFLSSAGAAQAANATRALPAKAVDAEFVDAWAAERDAMYCGALCGLERARVATHYVTYEEYCAAPSAFVRALHFLGLTGVALRDERVLFDAEHAGWNFPLSAASKSHKDAPSHYISNLREVEARLDPGAGATLRHIDACMLDGSCAWEAAGFRSVLRDGCSNSTPRPARCGRRR